MCNVNMCEKERNCENVNVKQTLDDNIRWRDLNKEQLTTNINNFSPEQRKNKVEILKSRQTYPKMMSRCAVQMTPARLLTNGNSMSLVLWG